MGVFSAGTVGAHAPDTTADPPIPAHDNLNSIAMTVEDGDDGDTDRDSVVPTGADAGADHDFNAAIPAHAKTLAVTVAGGGTDAATGWGDTDSFEITATADGNDVKVTEVATNVTDSTAAMGTFTIPLDDGIVTSIVISANDAPAEGTDTSPAGIYTIGLTYTSVVSSETPGDAVSVTLGTLTGVNISPDGAIIVKLPGFQVPSSIDTDEVSVTGTGVIAGDTANPSDIDVNGSTVTLTMGTVDGDATVTTAGAVTDIRFSKKAGIKNPVYASSGPTGHTITVSDEDDVEDDDAERYAIVLRQVSAKPASAKRGGEVTITGLGFADGGADVYIGSHTESATSADGVLTLTVPTDLEDNDGNEVFESGANTLNVSDGAGKKANEPGSFTIKPSFGFSPESPTPGQNVKITLVDITPDKMIDDPDSTDPDDMIVMPPEVRFAGTAIPADDVTDAGDTDAKTWNAKVPGGRIGSVQLRVIVTTVDPDDDDEVVTTSLDDTITIGTKALTLDVITAVPGQRLNIRGSGFTSGDDMIAAGEVKVGGVEATDSDMDVDPNGNIDITIRVPNNVKAGSRPVRIEDKGGVIGTASLTVPTPVLSIDPTESRIGTSVMVTGTGFPANDLVLVSYGGNAVGSAASDATGNFSVSITVPNTANIDDEHNVTAMPQINDKSTSAKAVKHSTPDEVVTLSPSTATPGQLITVSGENFRPFTVIDSIKIGDVTVGSAIGASTDANGSFSASNIQVPLLNPAQYLVSVSASGTGNGLGNAYLDVVTEVASTDPADVFASLIANGSLATVWHLDAATQSWTSFSTDPDLAAFNDLTSITGDQVYVLIMTAADTFNGTPLFVGTNQVYIP